MGKFTITSVILLLLTNAMVLAGVAYNRSGEPVISIELTERELPVNQSFSVNDENSGTTLSLKWQVLDSDEDSYYMTTTYGTPEWLDDNKLTELGFDMKTLKSDADKFRSRTSNLSAEAILVLEYQGDSYYKALASVKEKVDKLRLQAADNPDNENRNNLENYEKRLSRLKKSQTRLFVIDAGLDKQALLKRYADKNKYLLTRGEIGLRWVGDIVSGRIKQLYIRQLHVPLPLSEQVVGIANGEVYSTYNNNHISPRYSVRLNIGKRLEPWIESVSRFK